MKKLSGALLVLVMVFGTAAFACAAPYVSLNLGAVWVDDADFSDSGTYSDGYDYRDNGEISFETGFGMTAAFGYATDYGFRAELELGFRGNDIDQVEGTYVEYDPSGDLAYSETYSDDFGVDVMSSSLMFNGFLDLAPRSPVCPFVGAGVGFANIEGDLDYYGSEDETVFAYQLAAGVAFALNPNMNIDVQYRYFATEDPDFYGLEFEYATHNVLVGLRTSF
jgi:opacity protein-like surface antigen